MNLPLARYLPGANGLPGAALRRVRLTQLVKHILLEPSLQFLVLGAVLYAVSHYLGERARFEHIDITKEQVRRIADDYRVQHGSTPTTTQLAELVHRFVDDEIFYREALKLGLDQGDEIVRRRLVQKYAFLRQDLTKPAEPTDSQLLDYYQKHVDRYGAAEGATFNEVREGVRRDYLEAEGNRRNAEVLANLREHFEVVIE